MFQNIDDDAHRETGEGAIGPVPQRGRRSRPSTPKTLPEALWAAVEDAAPLYILGPDLFSSALGELFSTEAGRAESHRSGMIYVPGFPMMYRDGEARASYLFDNLAGLCWPCTKGELEKVQLKQVFTNGWASGDLRFLAEVTFEQLEQNRVTLGELVVGVAPLPSNSLLRPAPLR